jgi:hypothetical protein
MSATSAGRSIGSISSYLDHVNTHEICHVDHICRAVYGLNQFVHSDFVGGQALMPLRLDVLHLRAKHNISGKTRATLTVKI